MRATCRPPSNSVSPATAGRSPSRTWARSRAHPSPGRWRRCARAPAALYRGRGRAMHGYRRSCSPRSARPGPIRPGRSPGRLAVRDRARGGRAEHRVIHRRRRVRPDVEHLVPLHLQEALQLLLEREPGVVGAHRDPHLTSPRRRSSSAIAPNRPVTSRSFHVSISHAIDRYASSGCPRGSAMSSSREGGTARFSRASSAAAMRSGRSPAVPPARRWKGLQEPDELFQRERSFVQVEGRMRTRRGARSPCTTGDRPLPRSSR